MRNVGFLAGLSLGVGVLSSGCQSFLNNNFHEVKEGVLYRSAQLSREGLVEKMNENGFGTVINLRGGDEVGEQEVCGGFGVRYVSVRLSARRMPRREEVLALIKVFDEAKLPVYVHCRGGADRAGLAVGVYRIVCLNESLDDALECLDMFPYGHISSSFISSTSEIDAFFEKYRPYEGKVPFRVWVEQVYRQ